jgi:hypothetical protein
VEAARKQGRARRFVLGLVLIAVVAGTASYILYRRTVQFPGAPSWARGTILEQLGRDVAGQRTKSVSLQVEFLPEQPGITCKASLSIASLHDDRREFCLFLNPGLRVFAVNSTDGALSFSQRSGILRVLSHQPAATGELVDFTIEYAGTPQALSLQPCWISSEHIRLPWLSLWYPTDLQSFHSFECKAVLPVGMRLAGRDITEITASEVGKHTVLWRVERPINGMPFVAGRYQSAKRTHGASDCTVFWDEATELDAAPLLESVGAAHSTLSGLLGDDQFGGVVAVVEPGVSEALYAGGSVVLLPAEGTASSQSLFAETARALAHNWWGATVAPRWLTARPEAAAWLYEGLAEYSAWVALRKHHGRTAALRHVEQLRCPQTISFAMKNVSMLDFLEEAETYRDSIRVRGAFIASTLDETVQHDVFLSACRNVLTVHRYAPVSLPAFRQELELSAEVGLEEAFRPWFDRPGTFDYALADVMPSEERIRLVIRNAGDIPASGELVLALVSDEGVDLHRIDVGAGGGSFVLDVSGPVRRVVLDPFFATPDMSRANNLWPRRTWPSGLAAAVDGTIALAVRDQWNAPGAEELIIASPGEPGHSTVRLPSGLKGTALWSPDGTRLAFFAGATYVWTRDAGIKQVRFPEGLAPVGWDGSSLIAAPVEEGGWWYVQDAAGGVSQLAPCMASPLPGTLAKHPSEGLYAYVSRGGQGLRLLNLTDGTERPLASGRCVAGSVAWTNDGTSLVFMDRTGILLRGSPIDDAWEPIMDLGYGVEECVVAPGALRAAWIEPNGSLAVGGVSDLAPKRVALPGEVVDFAWEASSAIVCLVAETDWSLPMLFHADYAVWRLPVDTLKPERVADGDFGF